jgi:hypothetical protein
MPTHTGYKIPPVHPNTLATAIAQKSGWEVECSVVTSLDFGVMYEITIFDKTPNAFFKMTVAGYLIENAQTLDQVVLEVISSAIKYGLMPMIKFSHTLLTTGDVIESQVYKKLKAVVHDASLVSVLATLGDLVADPDDREFLHFVSKLLARRKKKALEVQKLKPTWTTPEVQKLKPMW